MFRLSNCVFFCLYISFFSLAVNGNWSLWSNWTDCSQPCGGGIMSRNRTCNNPMTASGGTFCSGLPYEQQDCNTVSCASFFSSNGLKAFNNLFVCFIFLPFLVIFNPCFVFQFEARFWIGFLFPRLFALLLFFPFWLVRKCYFKIVNIVVKPNSVQFRFVWKRCTF